MADVSCIFTYLQWKGRLKKISRCSTSRLLYALLWVMNPASYIGKGKAIAVQASTGYEGSRRLRFPHFKTVCIWWWLGYQPFARAAFTPRKYSWYSLLLGVKSTSGPWCGRKDYVNETCDDTTGNRTRDLAACSALPQPAAVRRGVTQV